MRKEKKKSKKYLRGRLVPFVTLVGSLIFISLFFGNFISGAIKVSGFQISLGLLDWPVLSGFNFAQNGFYFQTFIQNADLSLSPFTFNAFMKFISVYGITFGFSLALISAIINVIRSLKNIVTGKTLIKLDKNTGNMIISNILCVFGIPSLIAGEPLPFVENLIKFITFQLELKPGIFALLSILVAVLLFIFPYIVRTLYRINYRIITLEQNAISKSSDKISYRKSKKYDKGYKSFR